MLASELEANRGRWVAFDEVNQRVVASAESAEELYVALDCGRFGRVVVMRVPRLDEPLYVGLG